MLSHYQTKCPSCGWSVNTEGRHTPVGNTRACACCGASYEEEWQLLEDDPSHAVHPGSVKAAERVKKSLFNGIDWRSWATALAIVGLLALAGWAWPHLTLSLKKPKYVEQVQPLIKSMTVLSIATEDGLSMQEYRDLLLKVKVDYEDIDRYGLMGVLPNTADSIEKAMACYDGASFLWYNMQPGRDAGLNYADLLGLMNEGLGDELSEKIRSAILEEKKPLAMILNDSGLKKELISLFFASASRHIGEAKRSLNN